MIKLHDRRGMQPVELWQGLVDAGRAGSRGPQKNKGPAEAGPETKVRELGIASLTLLPLLPFGLAAVSKAGTKADENERNNGGRLPNCQQANLQLDGTQVFDKYMIIQIKHYLSPMPLQHPA